MSPSKSAPIVHVHSVRGGGGRWLDRGKRSRSDGLQRARALLGCRVYGVQPLRRGLQSLRRGLQSLRRGLQSLRGGLRRL